MTGLVARVGLGVFFGPIMTAFNWITNSLTHIAITIAVLGWVYGAWEHHEVEIWQNRHAIELKNEAAIRQSEQRALEVQKQLIAASHLASQQIAENSNEESSAYYDKGNQVGAVYASKHIVSMCEARNDKNISKSTNLPANDSASQKYDGLSGTTKMVAITEPDYNLLIANSLRLAQVHQDAKALIAAGIAESVNDNPEKQ